MALSSRPWFVAAAILIAGIPAYGQIVAQSIPSGATQINPQNNFWALSAQATPGGLKPATAGDYQTKLAADMLARRAFDVHLTAYWNGISEKRRVRIAKRRNNEPIGPDDYV